MVSFGVGKLSDILVTAVSHHT